MGIATARASPHVLYCGCSWAARAQSFHMNPDPVALSSAESEYYVLVKIAISGISCANQARGLDVLLSVKLYAVATAASGIGHQRGRGRTRHIEYGHYGCSASSLRSDFSWSTRESLTTQLISAQNQGTPRPCRDTSGLLASCTYKTLNAAL